MNGPLDRRQLQTVTAVPIELEVVSRTSTAAGGES